LGPFFSTSSHLVFNSPVSAIPSPSHSLFPSSIMGDSSASPSRRCHNSSSLSPLWPSHFTIWSKHNPDAIREFFASPSNFNFTKWEDLENSDADNWADLESCIATILDRPPNFNPETIEVCQSIFPRHTSQSVDDMLQQKDVFSLNLSNLLLNRTKYSTRWSEDAHKWLDRAVSTLAPRLLFLFKISFSPALFSKVKGPTTSFLGYPRAASSSSLHSPLSSSSDASIFSTHYRSSASHVDDQPHKIRKLSDGARQVMSFGIEASPVPQLSASPRMSQANPIPMTDIVILVLLDKSAMGNSQVPGHVTITLDSITDPTANQLTPAAIHSQHFSWSIFVDILREIHIVYDCRILRLFWAKNPQSVEEPEEEISNQQTFSHLIGLLHWEMVNDKPPRPPYISLTLRPFIDH